MKSRERVHNTLDRKPVDRIPYSLDMTSRIFNKLAAHYGILPEDLNEFLGNDLHYFWPDDRAQWPEPGTMIDIFGVVWDRSEKQKDIGDWGAIMRTPLSAPCLEGYSFPSGRDPKLFAGFDIEAMKAQDRFAIMGVTGLLDICWHLRGFENYMEDMAGEEDFAARLMDCALEYLLDLVGSMPDGADAVRVDEDWGLQRGLVMNPSMWRKYLKPRLRVLYGAIRRKGLRVMIHTCGDITDIFPDIIEIGVEAVNAIQPEAMDVAFLQREYGNDITMYGGVGSQSVLVYGSPRDVLAQINERLRTFESGGYILAPSGAIPTDAPIGNVAAFADFCLSMNRKAD